MSEEIEARDPLVVSGRQRERIEKALGEKLNDTILNWGPLGRRIIVVRDSDSEMTEGKHGSAIYKPQSTLDDMRGEGWILAIGPQVGLEKPGDAEPSSLAPIIHTEGPEAVLGAYVMWGKYVGRVLKSSDTDEDFRGKYLLMIERDLQSIWRS